MGPNPVRTAVKHPILPPAVVEAYAAAVAYSLPPGGSALDLNMSMLRVSECLRDRGFQVRRLFVAPPKAKNSIPLDSDQQPHGNMAALPFDDATFNGVYTLEASTVLPDLLAAPAELKRILAPHGVFVNATSDPVQTEISNNMEVGWDVILKRNNLQRPELPDTKARREFDSALQACGLRCEAMTISRWKSQYSPRRRLVETAAQAKYYKLPADLFEKFMRDYERWLKAQYGTIDVTLELVRDTTVHIWR